MTENKFSSVEIKADKSLALPSAELSLTEKDHPTFMLLLKDIMQDVVTIAPHLVKPVDRFSQDQDSANKEIEIPLWDVVEATYPRKHDHEDLEASGNETKTNRVFKGSHTRRKGVLLGSGALISQTLYKKTDLTKDDSYYRNTPSQDAYQDAYQFELFRGTLLCSRYEHKGQSMEGNTFVFKSQTYIPRYVTLRSVLENYSRWREPRVQMILEQENSQKQG